MRVTGERKIRRQLTHWEDPNKTIRTHWGDMNISSYYDLEARRLRRAHRKGDGPVRLIERVDPRTEAVRIALFEMEVLSQASAGEDAEGRDA